ncbi:MAG TPA: ATP-binding protein [Anaeromyxobacteraceae bacterium]|nr:ATP-binding protein [Anaeromyxobacteraceae bacterium]
MAMGAKATSDERPAAGAPPGAPPRHEGPLARLARAAAPDLVEELGYRVPWRERLSTKLLLFLGLAALAAIAGFTLAELRIERQLMDQALAESELLSRTVAQAVHRAMLQDRRDDAYRIMEDVAAQPGIDRVRMLDRAGRVAYSTDPAEAGVVLDRGAEACAPCHAEGGPRRDADLPGRSRVQAGRGGRVLSIITPIVNEPGCSTAACHAHASGTRVLGVLDVGLSLARLDAATAGFRWRALGATALGVALLGLAFWAFARRHVVRPVGALVAATHRVAREELDEELPPVFDGELGLLADQFNAMTRALKAARADLRALLADLERRVAERTDALAAAREELVRTEKLASLGKLASSIAHEINNPISGIMTFARLIARTLEHEGLDDAARRATVRHLALVEREAERCSDIVRNLLDFAHDRALAAAPLSPNAVVEDAILLVANQLRIQGIMLEKRLGEVPHTLGDFGLLRQACVNVLMNACEAMPHGGTLRVATALVDEGRAVEVAFQDTGPGIPKEKLARVFDPFFSTKEHGTGLGLSVVYGVAARHGGTVEIRSEPGQGTWVGLRLPVRHAEEGPPGAGP